MGDLKQDIVAKMSRIGKREGESINEVQKEAENMSIIDKTMATARKLSGAEGLAEQLDKKDRKIEEVQKEREKAERETQNAQLQLIQSTLGSKIERLGELIDAGGSRKSITEQIGEVKKAATELGLGTSKVSEFKEMATLIQSLNPHRDLTQQIKDAKDLLSILQPDKAKEAPAGALPAEIVLQVKKIDADLQIKLEEMRDERQRKDQDFKLTLLKYEEDRDIRRQEVDGNILVQRERNELIAGALKTVGGAIGQGMRDGVKSQPGGISQAQPGTGKIYQFEMPEGTFGTTECTKCGAPIVVAPTTTLAECVKCNTQYPVVRTPAVKTPEPSLAKEEE